MAVFNNQATLSYNGITKNSNIATGEVVETLVMTKTSVETTYGQNTEIRYIISIQNSGNTAYNLLTMTDDLGTYALNDTTNLTPLRFVDGTLKYFVNGADTSTLTTAFTTNSLTINNITVPANGNAIIAYTTETNEYAPLGAAGEITNTVTLTGAGIVAPVTASATVNAAMEADLTISKAVNPTTVQDQGQLTFTFTIQNTGGAEADAAANVQIVDQLDPVLTGFAATYNGTQWSDPANYTYTPQGLFTTVPGQITVPAATYEQDPTTGVWTINPSNVEVQITGTV